MRGRAESGKRKAETADGEFPDFKVGVVGVEVTRPASSRSAPTGVGRPFRAEFFGELQAGFQQVGGEDADAAAIAEFL